MTHRARLRGRCVQVLRPSKGGLGPRRWHTLIRIPPGAKKRKLKPVVGKSQQGVEYKWRAKAKGFRVRIHDRDPSVLPTPAVPQPNAFIGWVVRISCGKRYMDPEGRLHHPGAVNPASPHFDEYVVNETHMPIAPPTSFP